jgi:hypothetical protein
MRFESVGHPEPTVAQKAADLSRGFALFFQKIRLFFELPGYSAFPHRCIEPPFRGRW